jgi:dTMP kinase
MQGKLITFDGPEGAGKTTVCSEVIKNFNSQKILMVREPGSTPVGEKIRAILKSEDLSEHIPGRAELFLFEAARACIVDQVIKPALKVGTHVLCDRFFDSTTAYQGYGRGLSILDIDDMNMIATEDLLPDLTIIFDLPPEVGMARRNGPTDRIEAAGLDFHRKVRDGFLDIAVKEPKRCRVIDASKPLEQVVADVCAILKSELGW